ncbi:MAG: nucleotidyltransferase family protein [Planctomycetes bacterium]|nr:nucleotidyltransferase family protein [Planctomycetota bacterium]
MDFKHILEKLLTAFKEQDIRYALMGGFAMGLWGGSRSTVDLDFLVHRDDMQKVHIIVTVLGYEIHHKTENVSQYTSPLKVFGGIDFIHAFREASVEMLQRAVEKDIFSGMLNIRTLLPEDIIGLKLQAVYNNPPREKIDMPDIELLISAYNKDLDWELLEKYCKLFDMEDVCRKLRGDLK